MITKLKKRPGPTGAVEPVKKKHTCAEVSATKTTHHILRVTAYHCITIFSRSAITA
jgi:hypothetical protein